MSQYKWANNQLKLNRALAEVGGDNENKLKAEYVRIGGKLNMDEIKPEEVKVEAPVEEVKPAEEVAEEVVVPEENAPEVVVEETEPVVTTDDAA